MLPTPARFPLASAAPGVPLSRAVRTRLLIPSLATVFLAAVACGGSSGGDGGGSSESSAAASSVQCSSLLSDKDWASKVKDDGCEDQGVKQAVTSSACRDGKSEFVIIGLYGWGRSTGELHAGPQSGDVYQTEYKACVLGS